MKSVTFQPMILPLPGLIAPSPCKSVMLSAALTFEYLDEMSLGTFSGYGKWMASTPSMSREAIRGKQAEGFEAGQVPTLGLLCCDLTRTLKEDERTAEEEIASIFLMPRV